jgi:PASTA domain
VARTSRDRDRVEPAALTAGSVTLRNGACHVSGLPRPGRQAPNQPRCRNQSQTRPQEPLTVATRSRQLVDLDHRHTSSLTGSYGRVGAWAVYPWNTGHVGDEPPIHIESKVTTAGGRADAGDVAPGQWSSASRVVRGPGRWSRLVGLVAVLGLCAGGLLWWAGDGEGDGDGGDKPYCGIGGNRVRAARIAFFEAGYRLLQAGSFAYRGEVHAAEQPSFPPSGWTPGDSTVEGGVMLEHGLTHDIAVDANGHAVETMTFGMTNLWTRSASTVEGLGASPWASRTLADPIALGPTGVVALGPTGVVGVIFAARDPREEAPDAAGRCVIRATVPAANQHDVYSELLAGADVLVTLDQDRNLARIVVRSAPEQPELVVELDLAHVGDPQAIAPPGSSRWICVERLGGTDPGTDCRPGTRFAATTTSTLTASTGTSASAASKCVASGQAVTVVPDVLGTTLPDAIDIVQGAGLNVVDDGVPEGDPMGEGARVRVQEPPAGQHVPVGACIGFRTGR